MFLITVSVIFILHFSCAKEEISVVEEETSINKDTLPMKEALKEKEPVEKERVSELKQEQSSELKQKESLELKEKESSESKEKESSENQESTKEEESQTEKEPIVNTLPHVIVILADDLGWNDVSFHGSPQIPTPNIDALAANSIILNNYYTESYCAPARASLLSGQYPIHLGLQHSRIGSGEAIGLPLDVMIMPEHFKNKGYLTYMVGKWNLGYYKKEYTPIYRGFDSFFGFYNEQIDYFDYTNYQKFECKKPFYGIDLQNGTTPIKNFRGQYATDVFTEKAVNIIENHDESKPLFLYMAHLAPHIGNDYLPLQAPADMIAKNVHIQDLKRRTYAGVVSALDTSVGKIIEALKKRSYLDNALIIFTSDNGGGPGKSSNFPLRGKKYGLFEGSMRVPCFVWSPLMKLKEPRTSSQLMHVSDWLPTLYSAVGGDVSDLGKIDGYNMWKALTDNSPSPRIEILHNLDPISGTSALRRGDYKLISGSNADGNDFWYGADMLEDMDLQSSMDEWVFKNESVVKRILEESGLWNVTTPDSWRNETFVVCKQPPPTDNAGCEPDKSPCLFNVAADPCEYNNLAVRYPRIVRSMLGILQRYNATATEPLLNSTDPRADPRCHGFTHVPWLEDEYNLDCPYY